MRSPSEILGPMTLIGGRKHTSCGWLVEIVATENLMTVAPEDSAMPPESARGSVLVSDSMVVRAPPSPPKASGHSPGLGGLSFRLLCCPLVLGHPLPLWVSAFPFLSKCVGVRWHSLWCSEPGNCWPNPQSCGLSRNQSGQCGASLRTLGIRWPLAGSGAGGSVVSWTGSGSPPASRRASKQGTRYAGQVLSPRWTSGRQRVEGPGGRA